MDIDEAADINVDMVIDMAADIDFDVADDIDADSPCFDGSVSSGPKNFQNSINF
jgi:hypothetical protein